MLIFKDINFSVEEEIEILLIKGFSVESHFKGYHAFMKEWEPKKGEIFNTCFKTKNAINKFAVVVEKEVGIVGLLSKGKSSCFIKTIYIEVSEKRVNLGNRKEVEVPCTLQ